MTDVEADILFETHSEADFVAKQLEGYQFLKRLPDREQCAALLNRLSNCAYHLRDIQRRVETGAE